MYSARSSGTRPRRPWAGHKRATSHGPRRRLAVTYGRPLQYGLDVNDLASLGNGITDPPSWDCPANRHVPDPCQNEQQLTVRSGHSRPPRSLSQLAGGRSAHGPKRSSKQWVRPECSSANGFATRPVGTAGATSVTSNAHRDLRLPGDTRQYAGDREDVVVVLITQRGQGES